jgi:hypothetical protein
MDSILNSVKQVVGQDESYSDFDVDILMAINSAFATLHQIGIGPDDGFAIEDDSAVWADFLGPDATAMTINSAKNYVCLKVKMVFDPPQTSYHLTSMEKQIQELEWRLNVVREGKLHPIVVVVV